MGYTPTTPTHDLQYLFILPPVGMGNCLVRGYGHRGGLALNKPPSTAVPSLPSPIPPTSLLPILKQKFGSGPNHFIGSLSQGLLLLLLIYLSMIVVVCGARGWNGFSFEIKNKRILIKKKKKKTPFKKKKKKKKKKK